MMPWPILPPLQTNHVPHQRQLKLKKHIALGSGLWALGSGTIMNYYDYHNYHDYNQINATF